MTAEHVALLEKVTAKLGELKDTVEGSLSIRAVGGVHIANELIKLQPVLAELKTAIEADIAAAAGE